MSTEASTSSQPAHPSAGVLALSRHPVIAAAVFALMGAAMVLSETVAAALPSLIFLAYLIMASAVFVSGAVIWHRHRDPRRPRAPRLAQVKMRPLPPEPSRQVHEIAYNCVLCGRPLTNPQSMRARVGSTCIQRHGPRYKMIPNPEHKRWSGLLAAAAADRAKEQARLNVEHERAMKHYRQYDHAWQREIASPTGQVRRRSRETGKRLVLVGASSAPAVFVGITAALPFL